MEKSEQLTLNDLTAFNIGDYVVHIDHGVGVFGGLVRMRDDKGRMHEVVKLMYKDGGCCVRVRAFAEQDFPFPFKGWRSS